VAILLQQKTSRTGGDKHPLRHPDGPRPFWDRANCSEQNLDNDLLQLITRPRMAALASNRMLCMQALSRMEKLRLPGPSG